MKKTITMITMMLVALTASAQGEWRTDTIKGDELKGTKDDVAHVFVEDDMGMFVFWENNDDRFAIISPKAMFNTMVSNGDTGTLCYVGLYDSDGNMKEKLDIWLTLDSNSKHKRLFAMAAYNNPVIKHHKKNIQKVLENVRNGDGYIRILTGRYNASDFDLKVSPYKD